MKLLRLKAEGFGCLQGEFTFDPARLTLVVDDNERGKSTLAAAIQAALYGLEDDRRRGRAPTPLERYRPWAVPSYCVELEFEHQGERYTIRRDFGAGHTEVWNSRGQDVTEEFRQGKGEYPVGQKLLGLSAIEYEKCSFVRQGELDSVVPAEEKDRRGSMLHARLEAAVDTRAGDANAAEALHALDVALQKYNSPELESTLQVENAIKRLETKKGVAESELHTLEQDFAAVSAEMIDLAGLAEREQAQLDAIAGLELERRSAVAADWRRELEEHFAAARKLEELSAEATKLQYAATLPAGAEAELRESVARFQEAQRRLDSLEARRAEERESERRKLEADLETVKAYRSLTAEDADQCLTLAAELRGVQGGDQRLRQQIFSARERLAEQGIDPERVQALSRRFASLSPAEQRWLRDQAGATLAVQTEVAELEQRKAESLQTLHGVDQVRFRRRVPAWIGVPLGVLAAAAGGTVLALGLPAAGGIAVLATGVAMIFAGLIAWARAGGARSGDRGEALRAMAEATARINQLKDARAQGDTELERLARHLTYRDSIDLMREWNEYATLLREHEPALRSQEQLSGLREDRQRVERAAQELLARAGGGSIEPARLEATSSAIRRAVAGEEKLRELERKDAWLDDEKRDAAAEVLRLKEHALGILKSLGVPYDPAQDWSAHVERAAQRLRDRERHRLLVKELIPATEARLVTPEREKQLRDQVFALEGQWPGGKEAERQGSVLELESRLQQMRQELEQLRQRRQQLRDRVGLLYDRYFTQRPALVETIERAAGALDQAQRFKEAVELARDTLESVALDTHRRWADFLNDRVGQLLVAVGTGIDQVRFGEDLDFSVRLTGGQQAARSRADAQLSAGARDQLFLAVRIAVSEFLSRGSVKLPLLLDDPLSTSDDERAQSLLRLLTDQVCGHHQVILLTCHRARFEAFAAADPARFSERVQWLDARGVEAERPQRA